VASQRLTTRSLRRQAISQSLFPTTTLQAAIDRLGFVQADPIRSPARAQDLILRQRVDDYRAGDLERDYALLDVEEDHLYAYGFLSKRVWQLLHPRKAPALRVLERKVLETVRSLGEAHPSALEAHLGRRRIVNAWGGYSKATTHALEWLHWRGLLRIARRENGIRVYRPAPPVGDVPAPGDRLRELILVVAQIFAPSPEKSLQAVLAQFRHLGNTREALSALVRGGALQQTVVDGVSYVWPAGDPIVTDVPRRVRFLAPFDPVVWDRRRFEHLWGWQYRFEAYTPVAKRVRGYYAMPLLWGESIVGWANVKSGATGATGLPAVALDAKAGATGATGARGARGATGAAARGFDVALGFVGNKPRGREFTREVDAEIARLERFLAPLACDADRSAQHDKMV
jgi:uncharacterized protein